MMFFIALLVTGRLVVTMLFTPQAQEFNSLSATAATVTKEPVVVSLPLGAFLSPQWFDLTQNYSTEFALQLGGIANRLGDPLAPTQVAATDTMLGNRVLLQWSVPLGQQYDGVEIYRSLSDTMEPATATATDQLPSSGYYFDTTVDNNTTYYYYFRSYRLQGGDRTYSDWSDIVSVIPTDHTSPTAPVLLSVTSLASEDATDKTIAGLLITWQASSSIDVATYNIYRASQPGALGQLLDEVTADVTSARDTSVQPGVAYYYTVTAVDTAGNESTTSLWAGSAGHRDPFIVTNSSTNTNGNN
jgi:hypothetical protein